MQISFLRAIWYCVIWVFLPVAIIFVLAAGSAVISSGSAVINIEKFIRTPWGEIVLSYVGVYLAITIITRNNWARMQLNLKGRANRFWVLGTIAFTIGLHIFVSEIDNILQIFFPMSGYWQEIFRDISELPLGLYILLVVITAPVVEELFMRGLVAKGLANKYSKRTAIIFTALLFGAVHMNIWQFTTAFVGGLFITWLYLTTDALLLAILAHAVHNGTDIIFDVFGWQVPGYNVMYETTVHQPWWFTAIGVLFMVVGAYLFKRGKRKKHLDSDHSFIIE